jgi:phosphatidylserine/phosphatidylglycerophosphate/cardiolipin synthase-like enzyme
MLLLALAGDAAADVFRLLDDPQEAMQARVDLIQQARFEVHAIYFLARNDRITLSALALLREAKRRGVPSVRLIVDANSHRIPKDVLAHLRDEGVEVRVYHPFTLRHPKWLFRRMHEKVVVVDSTRYVAGGRNLAESYFGLAQHKNYIDRDVYIEGASAIDANDHFERLWRSWHVAALKVTVAPDDKRRAELRLDQVLHELQCSGFIALDTGCDWSADQPRVDSVQFLNDPISRRRGPRVGVRLGEMLESAESSIIIESPYMVPSRGVMRLLEKKLAEGVSVTLLTNSLRSTDGVFPQAAYLKYRRRLARAGAVLHEYRGPDALHAKSAVIDGRFALVGSYNVDPRSQNLNTEVMCVTEDETAARVLTESIASHMENAWMVDRQGHPIRDRADPEVPRSRRIWTWTARLLLFPIVEKQL